MKPVEFPEPRFVRTNGIRMAVYAAGPETGLPVIFSHGFPELAFSWRHQIASLAAAGFRVLAPDQRGYGLTERPAAVEAYDIVHLVDDVVHHFSESLVFGTIQKKTGTVRCDGEEVCVHFSSDP